MRSRSLSWLLLSSSLVAAALGACQSGSSAGQGAAGEGCYGDGTCNAGLLCVNAVCTAPGTPPDLDAQVRDDAVSQDGPGDAALDTAAPDGAPGDASPEARADSGPADAGKDAPNFDAAGCSFSVDVQPIFTSTCAIPACHTSAQPTGFLNLSTGMSYANIVGVVSVEVAPMLDVNPGDPANSYLYRKITGQEASQTSEMPPSVTGLTISQDQIDTIGCWITQGAYDD